MADGDAFGAVGDHGGECVVDRGLDQQAGGGGAAFAVQRIDHEDGGIGGAVKVGIGKDDDRVLAAEFEMDAFQGVGALLHDHRAGAAFADEADGLDVGMFGQGAASLFAQAVDKVPDAGRQAGAFGDFDQQAGGEGENSAGLWTTVQPAARAGAIFQVDSMKGVFHGVMMPTGPMGLRLVMLT